MQQEFTNEFFEKMPLSSLDIFIQSGCTININDGNISEVLNPYGEPFKLK